MTLNRGSEKVWGLTTAERTRRIAARRGLATAAEPVAGAMILVNGRYVFDPLLLDWAAAAPQRMVTLGTTPLLAHGDATALQALSAAMTEPGGRLSDGALAAFERRDAGTTVFNRELFKTTPPFVEPVSASEPWVAERACFDGAYRGVTDVFTAHVFKPVALALMRVCVRLRLTPNMVTLVGLSFCIAAALLFWRGELWAGLSCALGFMILDVVDGKLARCTIRSSRLGDLLDHGTDVLHPPFWWLAWSHGVAVQAAGGAAIGQAAAMVLVGVYLLQRAVEAAFLWRWGMQIHLWRRFDSRFRLVTAQRNMHVAILAAALAVSAPVGGLAVAAAWSVASLAVHAVRALMAWRVQRRGGAVESWLRPIGD